MPRCFQTARKNGPSLTRGKGAHRRLPLAAIASNIDHGERRRNAAEVRRNLPSDEDARAFDDPSPTCRRNWRQEDAVRVDPTAWLTAWHGQRAQKRVRRDGKRRRNGTETTLHVRIRKVRKRREPKGGDASVTWPASRSPEGEEETPRASTKEKARVDSIPDGMR
eukprot:scaffold26_cov397-Pavlova_lutheri.AAC.17